MAQYAKLASGRTAVVTKPIVPPTCCAKGTSSGMCASPAWPKFRKRSIALSGRGEVQTVSRASGRSAMTEQLFDDAVE